MRTMARATSVLVAAGLAVPFWGVGPAVAATASETATDGAYFYSAGIAKPDESPAAPPNVTGSADGVAAGNLAVAARGGQEDKVSFLRFPLADAPAGALLSKAELTVPLVPADSDNVVIAADPIKVRACKAGDQGFSADDGAALSLAPDRLCEEFMAPAKATADGKGYVFDVTALAAGWLDSNDGVALTAADGAQTAPFQIVFAAADQATLRYTFTAPADTVSAPGTSGNAPDSGPVSTDGGFSSGGFDGGSVGGGFDGGSASGTDGGFGSVESPVVDQALPAPPTADAAAPAPQTAAAPPTDVRPAASSAASLRPTAAFWLGLLVLVVFGGLLSLILGDPFVASSSPTRTSRLSQALQARESAAGTGASAGAGLRLRPSGI